MEKLSLPKTNKAKPAHPYTTFLGKKVLLVTRTGWRIRGEVTKKSSHVLTLQSITSVRRNDDPKLDNPPATIAVEFSSISWIGS